MGEILAIKFSGSKVIFLSFFFKKNIVTWQEAEFITSSNQNDWAMLHKKEMSVMDLVVHLQD